MALYLLDLFGVAVFAVSGALTAGRKSMDLFGVIVVAVIAAIGGGTVRDILLDERPIFWMDDPTYIVVILAATGTTILYGRFLRPPRISLLVADAFGLAVFTFIGAQTAYEAGVPYLIVVVMGALTGSAGGIMRDVLCAEVPGDRGQRPMDSAPPHRNHLFAAPRRHPVRPPRTTVPSERQPELKAGPS
jgi:uncharacterized membrane protein YeiH